MIKIDKGPEPSFLRSDLSDLALEKLNEFYISSDRDQKRYDFPFNKQIDATLKLYLHKLFYKKCGYCEIKVESVELAIVDRFRPYNGVRDANQYYDDLYWWLVFNWDNLVYSCKECGQFKANYFPIKGNRASSPDSNLTSEGKLLINPCIDNPPEHFGYNDDGTIYSTTEEGNQTIELLRLNRTNLTSERIKSRKAVVDTIERVSIGVNSFEDIAYLRKIYDSDPDLEFLGQKRWVLNNELEDNTLLGRLLEIEDYQSNDSIISQRDDDVNFTKDVITNDYFPIESIYIKNFKCISELQIEIKEDTIENNSWLFLLGENGVGKSSILQAIAIGINANFLKSNPNKILSLVKKGKQYSEIIIKERGSDNVLSTKLVRKNTSITQTGRFNSFLIGYGSLRLSSEDLGKSGSLDVNKVSYNNLFNATSPLNDVSKWLRDIFRKDTSFFNLVARSIKQLLPHDFVDNELTIEDRELQFKNSKKLFSELSDGYKSTITLAVDIMMKLSSAQSAMEKMSGIVIIDELGNQLHPRWQMRIVNQLRSVFPKITFIISTHHPLCLRGSKKSEILLLKNIEDQIVAVRDLPNPSELKVDQILSSEFFGLNSLIDPDLEAKFNLYYSLLSRQTELNPTERKELSSLTDDLRDKKHLGASLREELMYSVIDNLLAQKVIFSKEPMERAKLKAEAIDRVKEIWSRLNIKPNDQS